MAAGAGLVVRPRSTAQAFPAPLGAGINRVTGPTGACRGGDVSRFGNGRIPAGSLCRIDPAGRLLRADAAYAFSRLARAWQKAHGSPLCVTSAYRSFDQQSQLYRDDPEIAAPPGVSDHGWGTAVDLCGGVQDWDSAAHRWLVLHAGRYGWQQPSWAGEDGNRPEPWHWEYAGTPGTFRG